MFKLTKVATAVTSALLMSAAFTARADITAFTPAAYADSRLEVTNFQILGWNGATNYSLAPLVGTTITGLEARIISTISASIDGVAGVAAPQPSGVQIDPLAVPAQSISHTVTSGSGAGLYTPYTSLAVGALNAGTYAGAASDHSGNGIGLNAAPPTTATTHAQVNLDSFATGSADSRQNLGTQFTLTTAAPLVFDVLFNAEADIRVALGQDEVTANAARGWGITVTPIGAFIPLLDWVPDGSTATGLTGTCFPVACAELFDSFDLTVQGQLQSIGDTRLVNPLAPFGVRVALPAGSYSIALNHTTSADAAVIPEPGSLALLGAALLGLAGLRRKTKKA